VSAARWLAGKCEARFAFEGAGPGEGARRAFIRAASWHRMNAREWGTAHVRHVPNRWAPPLPGRLHRAPKASDADPYAEQWDARPLANEVQAAP